MARSFGVLRQEQENKQVWIFGSVLTRQSFDNIFPPGHTHDRNAWNFSNSALQVSIIGSHNVNFVPHDSVDNTVIGVGALVAALKSLPALVSRNSKSDTIFLSQLFKFTHDAVRDDWNAFRIETIHHCG